MKSVSVSRFLKAIEENALVFDTRAKAQYLHDGLRGSTHLSLEAVQNGTYPDVAKNEAIYLLCEYGQISELVGLYLENAGFTNVHNVTGGMKSVREHAKLIDE
ncbi:MAG: rhodanese-like domain-containing protein [Trueperaceae bacterium]|nr:rhodanese-like domain-containing protein [Trueperaceae bacterium]